MRSKLALTLAAASAVLLAGCETIDPVSQSPDPAFGEALKYDMAIQTVDPEPVYPPDAAQPGDSGVKGAEAVKRYRTDSVKEVEAPSTEGSSSSGSGPR